MLQYLDINSKIGKNAPSIATDFHLLEKYYRCMVTVRLFDHKAIALQRTGKMGTYPSVLGHEVISAAIGLTMDSEDIFVPYYRDHVTQYIRGVSFTETLQYWGGDERGNDFQNCKIDLPWSVPIGSQTLHAAGLAFAKKYNQEKQCVVVTLGDGATSQGDFYEAINIAGTMQLPVVFVIHNNEWAISTHLSKQTRCNTLSQKAIAAGFDGITVDGNDAIAMHSTLANAIQEAKDKHKPSLIEAMTYRLGDHTTADDASRYRMDSELANAWKKDGINRLEKYLIDNNILTEESIEEIQLQAKEEIQKAVNLYLSIPPQSTNSMFEYMYANMPKQLLQQQEECSNA